MASVSSPSGRLENVEVPSASAAQIKRAVGDALRSGNGDDGVDRVHAAE